MTSIKLLTFVEATTINAVAKAVLEFYRSARELNQNVQGCVATFDRRRGENEPPNDFVRVALEMGLEVEVIPERRRFDLSVIPALRRIVEGRGADVVVTHSVKSHFLLWRSRLWRKHPWVAFHHGYTDTDRKMRLYNRLDRWSLPHADRVVTVCHAFAEELARSSGLSIDKVSIQQNAIRRQPSVSPPEAAALRSHLGIGEDERVVLSVGRLSREKAHIDLLAAFQRLRETKPDISLKLIIVGDGPERARLEATAESLGCRDRVAFSGQISDVQPYYAVADVFALPSLSEGSPNVLLEAMAANLAIVATAVGGVPEMVVNDESALLVPPNDPPSLSASMAKILTDKVMAQRLARTAAALVDTRYTPDNYVRSLTKIYSDVMEGRRTH
jgi:glycosyltransferase involved in cell wall biosynthesis